MVYSQSSVRGRGRAGIQREGGNYWWDFQGARSRKNSLLSLSGGSSPWAKMGGRGGGGLFCLPCRLFFFLWLFLYLPKLRGAGPGRTLGLLKFWSWCSNNDTCWNESLTTQSSRDESSTFLYTPASIGFTSGKHDIRFSLRLDSRVESSLLLDDSSRCGCTGHGCPPLSVTGKQENQKSRSLQVIHA